MSEQDKPVAERDADMIWLYTHCRAIGMTKKSDSGKLSHDIALFTTDLQAERDALRADAQRYQEIKSRYTATKTSRAEAFLHALGIDAEPCDDLDAAIDAAHTGSKT